MNDFTAVRVPGWYWAVAVAIALWDSIGVAAYLQQVTMTAADIAAYPQAQQELYAATPAWVKGAFAIAVFAGLAGAICLMLRLKAARPLFLVSLIAAIVQFGWVFIGARAHETIGPSAIPFPAFIIAVAVATLWFATYANNRGWLR